MPVYSIKSFTPDQIKESKQKAIQIMLNAGLKEVTSQRQKVNGTIKFYDPQANCYYLIYASGYVRRQTAWNQIYQLNQKRRRGEKQTFYNSFLGKDVVYYDYDRVVMPCNYEELAKICQSNIVSYRKR